MGIFDRRQLGDVISRLSDGVEEIEDLMLSGLASAISYAFQLPLFVGALFYLGWQLALVSLFVAPLFWLVVKRFSRKIKQAAREERRRSGSIGAVAEESLSNVALVQAYNRQEGEVARFRRENEGSFAAQMAATRIGSLFSPLVDLIELASVIVVIALGAYQLSRGNLTISGLWPSWSSSASSTPPSGASAASSTRSTPPPPGPNALSRSSTRGRPCGSAKTPPRSPEP